MIQIALAIIEDEQGNVLIIKRKKVETGSDGVVIDWAFPGGKIELGETLAQAAAREAQEETGHQIIIRDEIGHSDHPQFPVHIYFYTAVIDGEVVQQGAVNPLEIVEQRWVPMSELGNYFHTHINPDVRQYLGMGEL